MAAAGFVLESLLCQSDKTSTSSIRVYNTIPQNFM
jgi:hypothetical protein